MIITDADADPDGSAGAALVIMQRKAKGTGKTGWTKYALAFSKAEIPLSIRPDSRAVKLMHKVWGVATSIATARAKVRMAHEIRKKIPPLKP